MLSGIFSLTFIKKPEVQPRTPEVPNFICLATFDSEFSRKSKVKALFQVKRESYQINPRRKPQCIGFVIISNANTNPRLWL